MSQLLGKTQRQPFAIGGQVNDLKLSLGYKPMRVERSIYTKTILMVLSMLAAGIVFVYIPSISADSAANYMDRKASMALWLIFCYVLYAIWAFFIEKFYVDNYSEHLRYKDISLEFSNLDPSLRSEAEIFSKFYKLSGAKVKEISLIYNLTEYFKLKNELKRIEERKEDAKKNWLLQKKKDELESFKASFRDHPEKYFTGKGFVTFQNYKYAELFKQMYQQAYRKPVFKLFKRKPTKSTRDKFQEAVQTIINEKRQQGDENTKRSTILSSDTSLQPSSQAIKVIKQRPENDSIVYSLWKFMFESKLTAEQQKNLALMKPTLGENFKLKRTIDPKLINFNFSGKNEITNRNQIVYFVVLFVILPAIAYLLSFSVSKHQLMASVERKESALETIHRLVLTVLISLVDQLGYLLIEVFFYQARFVKASQMFHYSLTYYSFFNLIAIIIIPNLALKQAFTDFRLLTKTLSVAVLNKKYASVIFSNYLKLVFSALNFKLVKPFLINRLILKRHKRTGESSNIIFGISFLITSTFYVAFFGTINPSVFVLFTIALVCLYFWDCRLFRKMKTDSCESKTKKYQVLNDETTGLPILKRYDLVKLPVTIFSTALNILVVGTLIVSCFGYYGIGFEIDQAQQKKHNFFSKIKNFFVPKNKSGDRKTTGSFLSYLELLWTGRIFKKPQAIEIKPDIFIIFWNILAQLYSDVRLLIVLGVYLVYVAVYFHFNNNDSFINRVQKNIWKRQKRVENVNFEGKSFRDANPAYEILDAKSKSTVSEV